MNVSLETGNFTLFYFPWGGIGKNKKEVKSSYFVEQTICQKWGHEVRFLKSGVKESETQAQ